MPLSLSRPILEQGFLTELKQTKKKNTGKYNRFNEMEYKRTHLLGVRLSAGPSHQIGTRPCYRQHFSTLDSNTIAWSYPAEAGKQGQKTEEEVKEGSKPGT